MKILLAASSLLAVSIQAAVFPVSQITSNATAESWGIRSPTTAHGQILWVDEVSNVVLFNGQSTNVVQARGSLGNVDDIVFTLGSGAGSNQVIGVWRRGTDQGWISVNGGPAVAVSAVNPITNQSMNAEGVAVADGSVFMVQQAFSGGQSVKHVFRVNPVTGLGTNLTGNAAVPGVEGRLSTSQGQAAWPFTDNFTNVSKLHFYDGSVVRVLDTNLAGSPWLARGKIVYAKLVDGVSQVFLYDSQALQPAPVQLTFTPANKSFPRTDGHHVGWIEGRTGTTNLALMLYGNLQVNESFNAPPPLVNQNREHPFQIKRGQIFWEDHQEKINYLTESGFYRPPLTPALDFGGNNCCTLWLGDGFLAGLSLSADGGADREVFRITGEAPIDRQVGVPLAAQVVFTNGNLEITWEKILGVTRYHLYLASDPSLSPSNYQTLPSGQKISLNANTHTLSNAAFQRLYFRVSAEQGGVEGAPSRVFTSWNWQTVNSTTNLRVHALAADAVIPGVVYLAAETNLYKSINDGASWVPLAGGIELMRFRALEALNNTVVAATRTGDLYRSIDGGTTWVLLVDGVDIGESQKTITRDSLRPDVLYAGNFQLAGMRPEDSYIIKSTNNGANWFHLPEPPSGELRGYAIAARDNLLLAGGTGTPNLARSTNGGGSWVSASPGPGFVYALAIDPSNSNRVYAGMVHFSQTVLGIYQSTNAGVNWTLMNEGLPDPLPRPRTLLALAGGELLLGTDAGIYIQQGNSAWLPVGQSLSTSATRYLNALELTANGVLLGATEGGVIRIQYASLSSTSARLLAITRIGAEVQLSWDEDLWWMRLVSTTNLVTPTWQNVTGTSNRADGLILIRVPASQQQQFFRIR